MPRIEARSVALFLFVGLVAGLALIRHKLPGSASTLVPAPFLPPPRVAPATVPPTGAGGASSEAREKVALLQEILASHNDNDPRLDSEFAHLSPAAKTALIGFYRELGPRSFNGRGTVVFLLGRCIDDRRDLAFFRSVLEEQPVPVPGDGQSDAVPAEMLSVYPQLMAVRSLGRALVEPTGGEAMRQEILSQLDLAKQSPVAPLARAARRALARAGR
jgi:hypothetical protein